MDYLSSVIGTSASNSGIRNRNDSMVDFNGIVYCTIINGIIKLRGYNLKPYNKRYDDDPYAVNYLGVICYRYRRYRIIPGIVISSFIINYGQKFRNFILLVRYLSYRGSFALSRRISGIV